MSDDARLVSLHLLRHAHAGDADAWEGDDDLRPLSAKGLKQAERLAIFLSRIGFRPDAIVSSPKARAVQTAEIVASALGREVVEDPRLGGRLGLQTIAALLDELGGARQPVLVGHDPDFSELLAALTGARELPMKKGALARLDIVGGFVPGGGVLRWLLPPDALPRDA